MPQTLSKIEMQLLYRTSVIARVIFPKQSPLVKRDCFVGKSTLLAMTEFARVCTVEKTRHYSGILFTFCAIFNPSHITKKGRPMTKATSRKNMMKSSA